VDGKKVGTDINLYKLFVEQSTNLLNRSGRCGIVVPSGIYIDLGAKQLREMLFTSCKVAAIVCLSNERFLFQDVHHSVRFCLLSYQKGGTTGSFKAVFRINPREAVDAKELGAFLDAETNRLTIDLELARRLSPSSLSIREYKNDLEITISKKLFKQPLLHASHDGWNISFSAELHMTNDSGLFETKANKSDCPSLKEK